MIHNKKLLLLLGFLLSSLLLEAQQVRYGLSFDVGLEVYRNNIISSNPSFEETRKPYFSLGSRLEWHFKKPVYAAISLHFNQSNRQYTRELNDPIGFGLSKIEWNIKRKTRYLKMPLAFGIKDGRVGVDIGWQLLYTLQIDDSDSERLEWLFTESEPIRFEPAPVDYSKVYAEPFLRISVDLNQRFGLQFTLVHNSKNENYQNIYPSYRFALGMQMMWE